MPPSPRQFIIDINGQPPDAMVLAKDPASIRKPDFVYLHGAGMGTMDRIFSFCDELVDSGHSILAFNHSGAGRDAANLHQSSLRQRVEEARFVIGQYADTSNLTVCGSSMGGYVALKMLELFPVKNLILFCPGIFDAAAFSVPFDDRFSQIIRQPESWRRTDALQPLEQFTGKLLVVIGEEDAVIPPGVIELIDQHSPKASRKQILRLPGCPHKIQDWLLSHPEEQRLVGETVAQFSGMP